MGLKRPITDEGARPEYASRKKRRGFSVGPANLPDGTYRRKSAFRLCDHVQDSPLTPSSSEDKE
jgi:hypothetical protein